MSSTDANRRRGRLQFALVAIAFLGTPIVATLWYAYGGKGHHGDTVNRGALIDPPRPVPGAQALGLADAWTLVVFAPQGCAASCERTLVVERQVRLTFARDMDRVARVLVADATDAARLAPEHPDLRILEPERAAPLLGALAGLADAMAEGRTFVVDPLGNVMMTYAPDPSPKDVQADLKRLLKNSETWMKR